MTKNMLIDATQPEETRVAITDNNKLIEFDYESTVRKQLKGGIYLAKVTRVEPSLQAAFVNFGGNRHGFLPFSEIHPDYFRIPIADREALIAEQAEANKRHEEDDDEDLADDDHEAESDFDALEEEHDHDDDIQEVGGTDKPDQDDDSVDPDPVEEEDASGNLKEEPENDADGNVKSADGDSADSDQPKESHNGRRRGRGGRGKYQRSRGGRHNRRMPARNRNVEMVGGEDGVDINDDFRFQLRRKYKIQEVVKRGQIMLIQVSKEERGNKGAAVTTYLSLPGRYCVLMPNSPRAGGVSRKVDNFKERRRMKDILKELTVPGDMSVILRTAGISRTKAEIKRDLDYLTRLWNTIREETLQSTAPALIYEEGSLIKRSIRDLYTRDIESVHVSGEEGYKAAKDFMKMLIPSHAKRVKEYKDEKKSLFSAYQVESQINDIGGVSVTLKSGGYLIINPTEALVSIDVNSGRATKERHIEETALKTNLEAAEEVARQLRLRDLGGLVVIDFIDMEDRRNNRKVENRLRDALSSDRARIQVGRISSFGLLELSRQRLNPSLTEAQYQVCPHCEGTGHVRTVDGAAIVALRALESEAAKEAASVFSVTVTASVALYILNNKRSLLVDIEKRFGIEVSINIDNEMSPSAFVIGAVKATKTNDSTSSESDESDSDDAEDSKNRKSARRRGRRGGRRRNNNQDRDQDATTESDAQEEQADVVSEDQNNEDKPQKKPRRSRKPKADTADKKAPETKESVEKSQENDESGDKKDSKTASKAKAAKNKPAEKTDSDKPKKNTRTKQAEEIAKASDASNDDQKHARTYETVNEPPKQKKKGWWNKLVD